MKIQTIVSLESLYPSEHGCPFQDPSNTHTAWQPTNRRARESTDNTVGGSTSAPVQGAQSRPDQKEKNSEKSWRWPF
jgi:hypothetical protein